MLIKTNMVLIALSKEALKTHVSLAIAGNKWKVRVPYRKVGPVYVQELEKVLQPSSLWSKIKAMFKKDARVIYLKEN